MTPLPFAGPLLYLTHIAGTGDTTDLAVAQDGDVLRVWSLVTDEGEAADELMWTEDAHIALAPATKVAAR